MTQILLDPLIVDPSTPGGLFILGAFFFVVLSGFAWLMGTMARRRVTRTGIPSRRAGPRETILLVSGFVVILGIWLLYPDEPLSYHLFFVLIVLPVSGFIVYRNIGALRDGGPPDK